MSAAAATMAPLPLYEESISYWETFSQECKQQVNAINAVVSANDLPKDHFVAWKPENNSITMTRRNYPSTEIKLSLAFESWGPKICVSVRGYQENDMRFYPEEFEFVLGRDPDLGLVAISDEGRSLCAREFAAYVVQHFRRSFPGLSLPCPGLE